MQQMPENQHMSVTDRMKKDSTFIENHFSYNREITDPRFGTVLLMQSTKTKQFLIQLKKSIYEIKEFDRELLKADKIFEHNHPNILKLENYFCDEFNNQDRIYFNLELLYEFPATNFQEELKERQKKGQNFYDEEIVNFFYQMISANSYLQRKGQYHGNIQPLNIAYDKSTMLSKLIDTTEATGPEMQKKMLDKGLPIYQSPLTYFHLSLNNINIIPDPVKEDVFALGLTLLEIGNQQSVQDIYNKKTLKVDYKVLDKHIAQFLKRYGYIFEKFSVYIEKMFELSENKRIDFIELEKNLIPYEDIKKVFRVKRVNQMDITTPKNNKVIETRDVYNQNYSVYQNSKTNEIRVSTRIFNENQNYHSRVSNAPSEQNVSNIRYSQVPQYVRTENVVQQQLTVNKLRPLN